MSHPIPTISQLRDILATMAASTYAGVPGVKVFDSGIPGPCVGITAMTHGNEPSGLAAIWYLLRHFPLAQHLVRGRVVLVVNNLQAAEQYLTAYTAGDIEATRKARFIDINLNRLPSDALERDTDTRYEILRAQELAPIWQQFDIALDIHSTTQESKPMIITGGGLHPHLIQGFPISDILVNIEKVQVGVPAFGFYGSLSAGIPVMEIESGSHENPDSFQRAITCTLALLGNCGVIAATERTRTPEEYKEYYIDGSILVPNTSYRLTRIFSNFEEVQKETVLAVGNGDNFTMPCTGHTFFGSHDGMIRNIHEEALFLSRPVRKLCI